MQKDIARFLWEFCTVNDFWIYEVKWILSKENPADYLTRVWDPGDWRLDDWVFEELEAKWGPVSIDQFASHLNAKKRHFNSYYFCPNSEAVDCFTQDWQRRGIMHAHLSA